MNTVNNAVIELKKTPLHGWHVANGAKMGPFGEWEMPLRYGGELKEYRAVREKVGLFDISHMGVIGLGGENAEKLAQYVTTNDVGTLQSGDVQYTLFCNDKGGILDDVTVYKVSPEIFFFVVNANNREKIRRWLLKQNIARRFNTLITAPQDRVIFALQGPCAEDILTNTITNIPRKRYSFTRCSSVNKAGMIISRTGYTGEDGFEIMCMKDVAEILWKELLAAGKSAGLLPCGLVARDMLRTEAGMRLYENDIDETINPIEAGLERYVSLKKDFIGNGAIEKALALKNRGGGRFFTGFVMDVKPERGCRIFENSLVEDEIGIITSATYSPLLKKRIALGYLQEKKLPGEIVYVKIGEEYRPATVTALPFYSRKK